MHGDEEAEEELRRYASLGIIDDDLGDVWKSLLDSLGIVIDWGEESEPEEDETPEEDEAPEESQPGEGHLGKMKLMRVVVILIRFILDSRRYHRILVFKERLRVIQYSLLRIGLYQVIYQLIIYRLNTLFEMAKW